jgi:hypothetical protein
MRAAKTLNHDGMRDLVDQSVQKRRYSIPIAMMKLGTMSVKYTYRLARIRYADAGFAGQVKRIRITAKSQ